MKTAIVLSGGGALGDFEFGTLKFLYECGIRPDILIGTSVGALNATKLAAGEGAIEELEEIWRSLRTNADVYIDSPGVKALKSTFPTILESLFILAITSPTTLGTALLGAIQVGALVAAAKTIGVDVSEPFTQFLREKSLYILNPIRDRYIIPILERDRDRILNSNIELRLVAVSLEYGDLVYISQRGKMTGRGSRITPDQGNEGPVEDIIREPIENVDLVDAVMASATIPVIFAPVQIGDEHFADGGLRDVSPVRALFDPTAELDIDPQSLRTYVVDGSIGGLWRFPKEIPFDAIGMFYPLEENLITRTLDILVNEVLMSDVALAKEVLGRDRLTVFEPRYFVHDALLFNESLISINIDYGYSRAADVLLGTPNAPATAEALVALDMTFYEIAKSFGVNIAEVIGVIYLYWTNPDLFQRGYPFGRGIPVYEERVREWLSYVANVTDQVRLRSDNGLPSRSQAWHSIKQYNWPFAGRQPVEVRVNCRISKNLLFDRVEYGENQTGRIIFYNDSDTPIQLGSPILSGDLNSSNTQLDPATGQQIPPNKLVRLVVIFTQTRDPGYSLQIGTISVNTDNASQPTIEIRVVAINPAPAIDYSPLNILFENIAQGDTVTQGLIVANVGNEPLTTHSTITGLNADRFVFLSGQDLSLPEQNNNGEVRVTLLTDTIGDFQATLHLTTNDPTRPIVDVPLHGIVIAPPPPRIEIVPPQLNFGTVQIGLTALIPLSIRNTGPGPLRVELGRLRGLNTAFFSIHPAQAGVILVPPQFPMSTPIKIADVIYQPTGAVTGLSHSATLEILNNDPTQPIALVELMGYAAAPFFMVDPSDIDFGTNTLSTGISIYNFGSVALTITGVRLRSGIAFSLVNLTLPQVLAPSSSYSFQVNRRGAQPGIYQDEIDIFKNNENIPNASVTLRAEIQ